MGEMTRLEGVPFVGVFFGDVFVESKDKEEVSGTLVVTRQFFRMF